MSYLFRHLVREGPLPERRARQLEQRARLCTAERAAREDRLLFASLTRASESTAGYAFLKGKLPRTGLRHFVATHLPVIDKRDLLDHRRRYYPRGGQARRWWNKGRTSGTTGTPLEVFRDVNSMLWEHAFQLQHWHWAGFEAGARQVVLRGDPVVPLAQREPPYWLHDRAGNQLLISTRHLSEASAPHIAAAITAFGAAQIRAYPSALFELAGLMERLDLPPVAFRSIITGSEPLYPVQRERIERVFGGRVFDFYGMAERTVFAAECEHGRMHVHPEYSFTEILDERGRPTDGFGRLVGTTLHNAAMPLLRYSVTDSARWVRERCACGRSYPLIELRSGKLEDQLFDRDDTAISASIITFAFKQVAHIRRSQVAQVAQDLWELRIVPGPGFCAADEQALRDNFRNLVSRRVRLAVSLRDELPNLQSGKFKWISQEWKPPSVLCLPSQPNVAITPRDAAVRPGPANAAPASRGRFT